MNLLFIKIPQLARILSKKGIKDHIFICFSLWYFVLSRKFFRNEDDFLLQTSYGGKSLDFYLRYPMDLAVLHEIFIAKEYEWCPISPEVIFDLGAHFGDTALYYHSRFPNAKIIAVEPAPENFERLVKHTKNIPEIITVNAAVGMSDGEVELNIVNSTLGHSLIKRENSKESVKVSLRSLESLTNEYQLEKIDLLKFDIEGVEFDIFENLPRTEIEAMIGEIHFDLAQDRDLSWVEAKLNRYSISSVPLDHPDRCVIMAIKK